MYTLRFPFKLTNSNVLEAITSQPPFQLDGYELQVQHDNPWYVILATGIPSVQEAKDLVHRIRTGLGLILLDRHLPFYASPDVIEAVGSDVPKTNLMGLTVPPFNGIGDGERPCIYPTRWTVQLGKMGEPTITAGFGGPLFIDMLQEKLSMATAVQASEELETSMDLFAAHYVEKTDRARFLTLVIILETMAPKTKKDAKVKAWLIPQLETLSELIETLDAQDPAKDDFIALKSELGWRDEASIGSRLRQLIRNAASPAIVNEALDKHRRIYGTRSKLTHGSGATQQEVVEAYNDALALVRMVLLHACTGVKQGWPS